jgi:hypothetical protein
MEHGWLVPSLYREFLRRDSRCKEHFPLQFVRRRWSGEVSPRPAAIKWHRHGNLPARGKPATSAKRFSRFLGFIV